MRRIQITFSSIVLLTTCLVYARTQKAPEPHKPAATEDGLTVFFSPRGGCEAEVVAEIGHASKSVDFQAYSFTSTAIANALIDAQGRGVKVRALLDSKAAGEENREPDDVSAHGIPTWTDAAHPIAHNKVIIIDGATVITGSFNFTEQAEHSNAENLLVIEGKAKIAAAYEGEFELHLKHSGVYKPKVGK